MQPISGTSAIPWRPTREQIAIFLMLGIAVLSNYLDQFFSTLAVGVVLGLWIAAFIYPPSKSLQGPANVNPSIRETLMFWGILFAVALLVYPIIRGPLASLISR